MPRAGGVYYSLDRAFGPLFGTIGGIGTWCALMLKVAFALIGLGSYVSIFFPGLPVLTISIFIAICLGILNILGSRSTGSFQVFLVIGLLLILSLFITGGLAEVNQVNFKGIWDFSSSGVFSTAAMVYVSYVGITKVESLSEEVQNPNRNLPIGIFLALGVAVVVYLLGTIVMVGVVPMDTLAGDLTPVATAAKAIFGKIGVLLVSVAAILAFVSVANAGTMSASRYPLAMSRDSLMPSFFQHLGVRGMPAYSIVFTVLLIILILVLFDTSRIAKLASAFQLLMFSLVSLAVIVMRESRIESYDPGFRSPLYPWMQIIGIVSSFWLISKMGLMPKVYTTALLIVCVLWYKVYVKNRIDRSGAIFHVFENLGKSRNDVLDRELRGILKERGPRDEDNFEELVTRSQVINLDSQTDFETVVDIVCEKFAKFIPYQKDDLSRQFLEGTRIGATPVTDTVALPHLRLKGLEKMEMIMVRCNQGVKVEFMDPVNDDEINIKSTRAIFFLISPEEDPGQHLRMLAHLADSVEDEDFAGLWVSAKDEQELKEILLRDERHISLVLRDNTISSELTGIPIRDLELPANCLIAIIRRGEEIIVPKGDTVLEHNDRITVLGEPSSIHEFHERYLA